MGPLRLVPATALLCSALALSACDGSGAALPASPPPGGGTGAPPAAEPPAASRLNVVLGRPTDTSVAVSVLADPGTEAYVEYGTASGRYDGTTPTVPSPARGPVVIEVGGLRANTRYVYRVRSRGPGETVFRVEAERAFQTQRSPGTTFTFGVQGDSHPEREGKMFSPDLYTLNMTNVAARAPDFYFLLGDDFSIEGLLEKGVLSQANVDGLYLGQRGFLGGIGHSTPVFLVNGNHEQAAAYLLGDRYVTPFRDAPVLQGSARTTYFALPGPGGFYSADPMQVPGVGYIRDYYAWEWGDALFVVIDPYWHSPVPVDNGVPGVERPKDGWEATIGDEQYAWFKGVLERSRAKYKFVFEHHVLGTGRGAAALVHQYEWGGYNKNGTAYEFASLRRRWSKPIHQLMEENTVTIFFSGHDHLFAREKVDGIVYQSVPNPADDTYTAFNADAYGPPRISLPGARYDPSMGVTLPNAGFLEVSVSPDRVLVSYIRAVLPGDEGRVGAANGSVAFSYAVLPDRSAVVVDMQAARR